MVETSISSIAQKAKTSAPRLAWRDVRCLSNAFESAILQATVPKERPASLNFDL